MQISVLTIPEFDQTLRKTWQQIQTNNHGLANPCFCFEYTEAVATVCDDVYVAVMEKNDRVIGFFPFQRKSNNIAGPVGGILSDYHGVIISAEEEWSVEKLLQGCGLKIWDYDHLLLEQQAFEPYHHKTDFSPTMNLSAGFDQYVQARRESGSKKIIQVQRKWRKFERDVGELTFNVYSDNEKEFQQVIDWKQEQCLRTGVVDFMSWGWTTDLLEHIWKKRSDQFSGMLSVLTHQDEIIAAHLGKRSATVCHWWFPVYNHTYSRFSPGALLLLKLAEKLADSGINTIDLGKGDDTYKSSFATDQILLAEGSVQLPSITTQIRKAKVATNNFLYDSPYALPIRLPVRAVKKVVHHLAGGKR